MTAEEAVRYKMEQADESVIKAIAAIGWDTEEDLVTSILDLLVNIQITCLNRNISFDDVLVGSRVHVEQETAPSEELLNEVLGEL